MYLNPKDERPFRMTARDLLESRRNSFYQGIATGIAIMVLLIIAIKAFLAIIWGV